MRGKREGEIGAVKILVGVTGASGSIYACTLIRVLRELSVDTGVILSDMGRRVLAYECGVTPEELRQWARVYDNRDLFAPVASGSCPFDGMVIVPCSMHTLGAVAAGLSDTLLLRAASVALKERRRLVAVARETPLSLIHIENMATLTRAGGCVLPACPGFYSRPTEIWQLAESLTARILDNLGIAHRLGGRWEGGRPDDAESAGFSRISGGERDAAACVAPRAQSI